MGASQIEQPAGADMLRDLSEMATTSELLAATEDLAEILHRIAERARDVADADFAAISTFDEHGVLTRFVYAGMTDDQARRLGDPPRGRGLLGELANHDRPLRVDDLAADPRYTGWPEGHPDMTRFLGVPVRAGGRTHRFVVHDPGEGPRAVFAGRRGGSRRPGAAGGNRGGLCPGP